MIMITSSSGQQFYSATGRTTEVAIESAATAALMKLTGVESASCTGICEQSVCIRLFDYLLNCFKQLFCA
jgi:hypothetical protein